MKNKYQITFEKPRFFLKQYFQNLQAVIEKLDFGERFLTVLKLRCFCLIETKNKHLNLNC